MLVAVIISWIVLCLVVGYVAQSVGRSFGSYFTIALLLSPIIGFIILAIKGKATDEEILNENEHIFYCSNCNSTYSSLGKKEEICPECGKSLDETTILRETWRSYSADRKTKLKSEFANGQHMRNGSEIAQPVVNQVSDADELKKFKELLDMGIITQEEFDAKKKQLLGL